MIAAPTGPDIICMSDCFPDLYAQIAVLLIGLVVTLFVRRWRSIPIAAAIATAIVISLEEAVRALAFGEPPFAHLWHQLTGPGGWVAILINYVLMALLVALCFGLKRAAIWSVTGDGALVLRLIAGLAAFGVVGIAAFASIYALSPGLLPRRILERTDEFAGKAPPRCRPGSAQAVVGMPPFHGTVARAAPPVGPLSPTQLLLPPVHTTEMSFEHLIGPPAHIRVLSPALYEPHKAVTLTLAVSERGDVVAATPTSGPKDLFGRAVELASRWKFVPFKRDGRPIAVRVLRSAVRISGPELTLPVPMQFPDFADWESVTIRLVQHGYDQRLHVEIRGDGSVTFIGEEGTVIRGMHCAAIDRATLSALVDEFRRAKFFSMLPSYASEHRSFVISIALDDFEHEVDTSYGNFEPPEALKRLGKSVLDAVHAERWIRGNRFTGPTLAAEHWDFAAKTSVNAEMLSRVARGGDIEAVTDLLALGVQRTTVALPPSIAILARDGTDNPLTVHPAIAEAADAGEFDIVNSLLADSTRWPADALSRAYVAALEFGNAEIAAMLLAKGASPNARGYRMKTALAAAATSGLPDLVERELKRGADVADGDTNGFTPLHWAAGTDYLKTVDSVHADRAEVIKLLLHAGAKVDARAAYLRWTPLHSNWMGLPEVTSALIANSADVNAQDEDGNTPLMLSKSVESVRLLLAAGANPYLRNTEGKNALDVARADIFGTEIAREIERWMAARPERKR